MDIDFSGSANAVSPPHVFTAPPMKEHQFFSDGLLLYLAEATYESGSSPLSNWVPLKPLSLLSTLDTEDKESMEHESDDTRTMHTSNLDGPLDLFER